jgi:hypothetical protein
MLDSMIKWDLARPVVSGCRAGHAPPKRMAPQARSPWTPLGASVSYIDLLAGSSTSWRAPNAQVLALGPSVASLIIHRIKVAPIGIMPLLTASIV